MNNKAIGTPFETKLGKLIRLLASDKPGEVVAAADAINRSLRSAGMDIHRLAEAVESVPLVPQRSPDTSDADDQSRWRDIRNFCVERANFLTSRELEFITSMANWRGHPTHRQMNWLLMIERKIRNRQSQ
jgi:hypothetical protein